MKSRALGLLMTSGLLISSVLTAEPLTDLRTRLAALRNSQPIRLQVEIEAEHSESSPLHRSGAKLTGRATVVYGPKGVKVSGQRWSGSSSSSSWLGAGGKPGGAELPPFDDGEASFLVDPATVLYYLLWDAALLSDKPATWQGKPARLLVFVPTSVGEKAASAGALWRFTGEVQMWLGDNGLPLAMQHTMRPNVEPPLPVKRDQLFVFQEIEGRLLAARTEDTFSGAAWDTKTVKASIAR
ncbi:MAG: hypothetical protein WAM82_26725 [Thermoanaerobaculia bacterium]